MMGVCMKIILQFIHFILHIVHMLILPQKVFCVANYGVFQNMIILEL